MKLEIKMIYIFKEVFLMRENEKLIVLQFVVAKIIELMEDITTRHLAK